MIPGEILCADSDITLNEDAATVTLRVANRGDRPVQVGSHYHFFEANGALDFDRDKARHVIGGAIVASLGSVMTLGGSWMVVAGQAYGEPISPALALLAVVGLTPTIIGLALFLWGLRRLNDGRALIAASGGVPQSGEQRRRRGAGPVDV